MKLICFIIVLIIPLTVNSENSNNICFSKEEAQAIAEQLDDDKKIIRWQANRWKKLVNTEPKVHYKTTDRRVITQNILFPIENDESLGYTITFEIDAMFRKITYFPFKVNLGIMFESGAEKFKYIDPKIGLQFLGLEPLNIPFVKGLGFHALVGVQSAGLSVSWGLMRRPVENLRIHFYSGVTYKGKESFGAGISLNF